MGSDRSLTNSAWDAGGAHKTKRNRKGTMRRLDKHLRERGTNIRSIDYLKPKHVDDFVLYLIYERELAPRTVLTMVSDIRVTMIKAGYSERASRIKAANYPGLAGASRKGKRLPMSLEKFEELCANVKNPGVLVALRLGYAFGFRTKEMVMCQLDALRRFAKEIERLGTLYLVRGTKGGRPRYIKVIDRNEAISIVNDAIEVCKANGGYIIDAPNLKAAIGYFRGHVYRAGFKGQYCCHTMRYAWTQSSIHRYMGDGMSFRESLEATALDLGHGDGRGSWVRSVYANGMPGIDELIEQDKRVRRELKAMKATKRKKRGR